VETLCVKENQLKMRGQSVLTTQLLLKAQSIESVYLIDSHDKSSRFCLVLECRSERAKAVLTQQTRERARKPGRQEGPGN
jgi:hypothetical protein